MIKSAEKIYFLDILSKKVDRLILVSQLWGGYLVVFLSENRIAQFKNNFHFRHTESQICKLYIQYCQRKDKHPNVHQLSIMSTEISCLGEPKTALHITEAKSF